jgi:hypothetical protein
LLGELLRKFGKQAQMLESMAPGRADLLELDTDDPETIVVPESASDPSVEDLLLEIEAAMALTRQRNAERQCVKKRHAAALIESE